jgi:hypothetical protein
VVGLPAGQAPATQLDGIVEGWTETVNVSTYSVAFDSSPADNPARFVWDDPTYGRWQAAADCALNAALTAAVTTVVIKTPTPPGFTLVGARYPMTVHVGAEDIVLNTPPSGSGSPQTFTGVTRGANGTTASVQPINAQVQLWPASTWTL